MILSHEKKFVFIHVPKTGGSSIHAALKPWLKKGPPEYQNKFSEFHHGEIHNGVLDDRSVFWQHKDYLSFAFVRNPFERLFGYFWFHRRKNAPAIIGKSFSQFVKRAYREWSSKDPKIWFRPQSWWLKGEVSHEVIVDMVGRFENLEQDFRKICERTGINDPPKLEHFNDNPVKPNMDWRDAYTTETLKLASIMFREDMETFGYWS
jgi:hypothetical protein